MIQIDLQTLRFLVLGTDLLLLLLVLSSVTFFFHARRREYYRTAWRQMRSKRLPMVCMGICLLYAAVALMDSVHFQERAVSEDGSREVTDAGDPVYRPSVLTVLDVICSGLRERTEKTFSAPFASHQFTKETRNFADGSSERDFPRLRHGGSHLEEPHNRGKDIARLVLKGLLVGLGIGLALLALSLGLVALKQRFSKASKDGMSLQAGFRLGLFLSVTALVVSVVAVLSTKYHVLGTDQVGQDILYRALKGARVGLVLGTVTTLIATPLAILFGIMAGYFGGRADDVIQYLYTTVDSIPNILRIAAVMLIVTALMTEVQTALASDTRLLWLCVVLGVGSWTGLCRLLRGETLKVKENEYVQAAEAFGVNRFKIMFHHILPNVMHIVLISVVLRFSGLVLAEAVLAYVGIGVDPSMESWGNMINAARLDISRDPAVWWNLLAAFIFMFGLVLPANIFGDAVRDALDPKLKTE